jgi:hypothetical protein
LFADIAHDGAPLPVPTPAFFAARFFTTRFFTTRFFTIGILAAGFLAAASARSLPAATITATAITAAAITAAAITAAAITAATVTAATVITVPVPAAFGPFATTGKSFAATTGRAAFPTLSPTTRVPPAGLVAPPSRTTLATRALASLERSAALILPATPLEIPAALILPATPLEVAPLTLSTLTLSTLTLSTLNWPTLNWPALNWPALNWPALASLGLQFMKGQQPDHRDQQPDSALVSILASIPHVSYPLFCPGKKRHGRHPILTVF